MAELGTFSLRLAIFIAAYAVLVDLVGSARREKALLQAELAELRDQLSDSRRTTS